MFTWEQYQVLSIIGLIAEFGVDCEYQHDGLSLLMLTIQQGQNIDVILKGKPNLYHVNKFGKTALEMAIEENRLDSVSKLLDVVDIAYYNNHGINLVDIASLNLLKIFRYNRDIVHYPIFHKSESASCEILCSVLKAGANPNIHITRRNRLDIVSLDQFKYPLDMLHDENYGEFNHRIMRTIHDIYKQCSPIQ